jgi:hypothetical protein
LRSKSTYHFTLKTSARLVLLPRLAISALLLLGCSSVAVADKGPAATGFATELPNSEADVASVVQSVAEDHVIRGTYVYEHEKVLNEASAETSSSYFGTWNKGGRVFYKVRNGALAPRNFKDSSDIGQITVRYVVQATSPETTHLQISAVFVEDGTHRVHVSDTTVETSEYAEIKKQLDTLVRDRQKTAELRQKKSEEAEKTAAVTLEIRTETGRYQSVESSLTSLRQRASELQHAVEVRVSSGNTELKSAPFRTAATLTKLQGNSDVLVEIITPYWYGVETTDGHRGWLRRDQVSALP